MLFIRNITYSILLSLLANQGLAAIAIENLTSEGIPIGRVAQAFEDKSARLPIEQIMKLSHQFEELTMDFPNWSVTPSAWWLSIELLD